MGTDIEKPGAAKQRPSEASYTWPDAVRDSKLWGPVSELSRAGIVKLLGVLALSLFSFVLPGLSNEQRITVAVFVFATALVAAFVSEVSALKSTGLEIAGLKAALKGGEDILDAEFNWDFAELLVVPDPTRTEMPCGLLTVHGFKLTLRAEGSASIDASAALLPLDLPMFTSIPDNFIYEVAEDKSWAVAERPKGCLTTPLLLTDDRPTETGKLAFFFPWHLFFLIGGHDNLHRHVQIRLRDRVSQKVLEERCEPLFVLVPEGDGISESRSLFPEWDSIVARAGSPEKEADADLRRERDNRQAAVDSLGAMRAKGVGLYARQITPEESGRWREEVEDWQKGVRLVLERGFGPATVQTFTHLGPVPEKSYEHSVTSDHLRELAMLDLRLERLQSIIDRHNRD